MDRPRPHTHAGSRIANILGYLFLTVGLLTLLSVAFILFLWPQARVPGEPFGRDQVASAFRVADQSSIALAPNFAVVPAVSGEAATFDSSTGDELEKAGEAGINFPSADDEFAQAVALPDTLLTTGQPAGPMTVDAADAAGSGPAVDSPIDSPLRVEIPALAVNAPIQPVGLFSRWLGNTQYWQWAVPNDYAVGWHDTSAPIGQPGNIVLNGHNNVYGAVLRDLVDLPLGGQIILHDGGNAYNYEVVQREILAERGQPPEVRAENAHWMDPTDDERLTLITCWPDESNSHRLIVVAMPVLDEDS